MSLWMRCVAIALLLAPLGCAEPFEPTDPLQPTAVPAAGPLLGAADGQDSADRACRVTLVEIGRRPNDTGGYVDNGHEWIWLGLVDVAQEALDEGARPGIIYHLLGQSDWYEVWGTPTHGAADGFQRYEFQVADQLIGPGMSGTALTNSVIELIPVLHLRGGGRLFDHNRHPNDFDNYVLTVDSYWTVASDASVCSLQSPPDAGLGTDRLPGEPEARPNAVVTFTDDWQVQQAGRLVAGGLLEIDYDIDRLSSCRATHNGYPSWDVRAYAEFQPGAQRVEASVRAFESHYGTPTNTVYAVPAVLEIPAGAESVAIWFYNVAMTGGTPCETWDSNMGANYRFEIDGGPGWMGGVVQKISRAGGHPCEGGEALEAAFDYGTWPRQRAVMGNVCFEVWQEGVTDWDNPSLWQELDVQAHWRFGDGEFTSEPVEWVDRTGNNARYVFDIARLDPFRPYNCPQVPTYEIDAPSGESREGARLELFFTVNGFALRPATDAPYFVGEYWDYADSAFRAEHCGE